MDEQGHIQTRFLQADDDNPRLKKLGDEAKTSLPATIAPPVEPKPTPAPRTPKTPMPRPGGVGMPGAMPPPGGPGRPPGH